MTNAINPTLTLASRVFGIAIAAGGLAVALKFADDGLGDAGAFWNGLAMLLGPAILGGLVILAGDAAPKRGLSTPRWQTLLGAVALLAILALALKASDTRILYAGGETGVWGFLRVMSAWSPLAVLLLLANPGLSFPNRRQAIFGLAAGLLTIVVALAIGAHAASRTPISGFWQLVGAVMAPGALGLLLVMAARDYLPLNRRQVQVLPWAAAGLVFIAVLAYSIWLADYAAQDGFWIGLGNLATRLTLVLLILLVARSIPPFAGIASAIAISLALCAYAVWWTSSAQTGGSTGDIWIWLLIATTSGSFAVLATFLCLARSSAHGKAVHSATPESTRLVSKPPIG